ncbi:DNA-binding protein [Mycobacterium sp. WMMD1722]|uniref:DNA-binding protein n=1 Tax=Mycobacterium sp. WMMD1722 TaxID=3404117 RepID=UPI003BF5A7CB
MADIEHLPALSTPAQLAEVMQTTTSALAQDRYLGRGIPYVKFGKRIRYLREDVLSYLAANRVSQTGRPA